MVADPATTACALEKALNISIKVLGGVFKASCTHEALALLLASTGVQALRLLIAAGISIVVLSVGFAIKMNKEPAGTMYASDEKP